MVCRCCTGAADGPSAAAVISSGDVLPWPPGVLPLPETAIDVAGGEINWHLGRDELADRQGYHNSRPVPLRRPCHDSRRKAKAGGNTFRDARRTGRRPTAPLAPSLAPSQGITTRDRLREGEQLSLLALARAAVGRQVRAAIVGKKRSHESRRPLVGTAVTACWPETWPLPACCRLFLRGPVSVCM